MTTARKPRKPIRHRPKPRSMPNGQIKAREKPQPSAKFAPMLSQNEHIEGLWVALGLSDVAD